METTQRNSVHIQEVDGEEIAVEEGIAQAHQYCAKIGMKLDTIVSVQ